MLPFPFSFWGAKGPWINSIQQVSITISSGSTSNTATISAVGSGAFIIFQGWTDNKVSTANMNSCAARVTLTNSTTVTATRNTSLSDAVVINAVVIDATSSLVSAVQFGTIAIANTSTSNTATITSVDTSRSVVFFLGEDAQSTAVANGACGVTLTNATTVTANRIGTASQTTVSFCVVQFAVGVVNRIQQFSSAFTSNSATDTQTITSVNTANSFIAYGGCTTSSSALIGFYWMTLTNSTTVTLTRTSTATTSRTPYYTVVEFNSGIFSQMQRGSITLASVASNTATITSATTTKSVCNWLGFLGPTGAPNYDELWPKITQTNATTLTATKNTAGTTSVTVGYEVWTFNQ